MAINTDDVRLLTLLPGSGVDEIRLTRQDVRLQDAAAYNALSYVWGDASNSRSIFVSGSPVNVTNNLFNALCRLRHPSSTIEIWIDQLCIDLENSTEKARQVSLMRDIYRKATLCWLWFGETPRATDDFDIEHAEGALDFIRLCARRREDPMRAVQIPETLSSPTKRKGAHDAFKALLRGSNPWWDRIWTVQEAVLPSNAVVIWGPLSIPWALIERAASNLCTPGAPLPPFEILEDFHDVLNNFTGPVRGLQIAKKRSEDPLNLLQRWRERKATDPKDKVYALIGLVQPTEMSWVNTCDYTIATSKLYGDVTATLIIQEQSLRPLVGARAQATPGLPSWALDFATVPEVETTEWWWNSSHKYKWYSANCSEQPHFRFQQQNSVLELRGTLLGTVAHVGKILKRRRGEIIDNASLIDAILSWEVAVSAFMQAETSEPYGEKWIEAFWRTTISDLLVDEFPLRRGDASHAIQVKDYCHGTKKTMDREIFTSLHATITNRVFFITKEGYFGVGPENVQLDNQVWTLQGGNVPFVLRAVDGSENKPDGHGNLTDTIKTAYTLVGDAFVHGVMDGERAESDQIVHLY